MYNADLLIQGQTDKWTFGHKVEWTFENVDNQTNETSGHLDMCATDHIKNRQQTEIWK